MKKDKPYNAMVVSFGYEDINGFTSCEQFLVVKDGSNSGKAMDNLYESLKGRIYEETTKGLPRDTNEDPA